MTFEYISDPKLIEKSSFTKIRELIDLSEFDREQQQVVMRVVHSLGRPQLAKQVRFSENACQKGMKALAADAPILCDVEMVKQGITKQMINKSPLCFLNYQETKRLAQETGETYSMAALELWHEHLDGSVVVIGNAPTALFRLLELLEVGAAKPALIIGMPVGFVGAEQSKLALWNVHESLGIECITLLGLEGGCEASASTCNALLRCILGEYF